MDYFIAAFKQFADFSGRTRRKDFWMFILFYWIFYVVLATIDVVIGTMFLATIYGLVMFVPTLSIGARRLHDTTRSGWWQLLYLIPIIGLIIMIVFLIQDSHNTNDYGPNPKANDES